MGDEINKAGKSKTTLNKLLSKVNAAKKNKSQKDVNSETSAPEDVLKEEPIQEQIEEPIQNLENQSISEKEPDKKLTHVIVEAKTKKKAIAIALKKLNLSEEDVTIKVLQKSQEGLMGFFAKKCKIKVSLKDVGDLANKVLKDVDKKEAEIKKPIDGYFEVNVSEAGCFLTVYPPMYGGKAVTAEEANETLSNHGGIGPFDPNEVGQIILQQFGTPMRFADFDPSSIVDAKLDIVSIAKNNLKVVGELVSPKGGKHITYDEVISILNSKGIVYGIIEENIRAAVDSRLYENEIEIAKGKPAVNGKDAQIEYVEKIKVVLGKNRFEPKELENGAVDFKELGRIINIHKGDLLVSKTPLTGGTPGTNIYGQEVAPTPGKDKFLKVGKNVVLSEDELSAYADITGQVVIKNDGKIEVLPILEVKGNVDYSEGNIDFCGSVIVGGEIMDGFNVKAEGDVVVKGVIGASEVISGGNVIAKNGVVGRHKGRIEAEGDVICKFVENGEIISKGQVVVDNVILHSNVIAKDRIVCISAKGLINGGKFTATNLIEANILGSYMSSDTTLEVGVDPFKMLRVEALADLIEKTSENIDKLEHAREMMLKKRQAKDERYIRIIEQLGKLKKQVMTWEKQKDSEEVSVSEKAKIKVAKKAFSGLMIKVCRERWTTSEEYQCCSFYYSKGEVKLGPY